MNEAKFYTVWMVEGQEGKETEWRLYAVFLFRREARDWLALQESSHDMRYRIVKGKAR